MERIDLIKLERDENGNPVQDCPFYNGPAEFLVNEVVYALKQTKEWCMIFGDSIDNYKREDYSMRALPALRIYNEIARKDFESWWVQGDLKADIILPAVLRRTELQQVQDTLSMALLQQFRRPMFFDTLSTRVPGLNELGKQYSVDKTLGFEWDEQWVPLTQIIINFRIDLRIWDDYLEATDRTKDSPFEAVLANLTKLRGTINALQDDLVTTDVQLQVNQTPGVQGVSNGNK